MFVASGWSLKWLHRTILTSQTYQRSQRTNPTNQVSYKATLLYYNWLKERISNNVPFNKIVQELLSATGGTLKNPPTAYFHVERDTLTAHRGDTIYLRGLTKMNMGLVALYGPQAAYRLRGGPPNAERDARFLTSLVR